MFGPRYDDHFQTRRRDFHAYDGVQVRNSVEPPARTGVPEQGYPAHDHRQAGEGRAGRLPQRDLPFERRFEGVRAISRRHARRADHRIDHLSRYRKERRAGRSGHAVQRFVLGERPFVCQQHQYDRRRYAPHGLPPGADAYAQKVRRRFRDARQVEVRHQRRRLPRGAYGRHFGEGRRAAVRGTDQDQTGQRRGGRIGRSGRFGGAGQLLGGESEGCQGDRGQGGAGGTGAPCGAQGARSRAAQDAAVGRRSAGQAGRLFEPRPVDRRDLLRRG